MGVSKRRNGTAAPSNTCMPHTPSRILTRINVHEQSIISTACAYCTVPQNSETTVQDLVDFLRQLRRHVVSLVVLMVANIRVGHIVLLSLLLLDYFLLMMSRFSSSSCMHATQNDLNTSELVDLNYISQIHFNSMLTPELLFSPSFLVVVFSYLPSFADACGQCLKDASQDIPNRYDRTRPSSIYDAMHDATHRERTFHNLQVSAPR